MPRFDVGGVPDVISKMAGTARQDEGDENEANSLLVPDLETQKNEIGELLKTSLKKGDTW